MSDVVVKKILREGCDLCKKSKNALYMRWAKDGGGICCKSCCIYLSKESPEQLAKWFHIGYVFSVRHNSFYHG